MVARCWLWRSRGRSFAARGYRSSSGALPGHPVRYPADRHHRRRAGRRQLMRLATDQPGRQRGLEEPGYLGRGVAFSGRDCGSEEWLSTMKGCVLPTASRSRPGSFSPPSHQYPREHHERRAPSGARGISPAGTGRGLWRMTTTASFAIAENRSRRCWEWCLMPRWSISAPSAKRCFRRCVSVLWLCRPRWRMLLRTPLARCCAGTPC